MTSSEFKKVARLLKEAYKELETQAIGEGLDIFGDEYKQLQSVVRERILERLGFTIEEYREAKELVAPAKRVDVAEKLSEAELRMGLTEEKIDSLVIPNEGELLQKMQQLARDEVKPPVIQNNIVERTTVEKPTIVKETVIEREEYDDAPVFAELGYLNDRLDNIKIPELPDIDSKIDALKVEMKNDFIRELEHNIDTLGMPDFRKLAMGLQAQIDTKIEGVGVTKITVSDTAPANPDVGELWIDTAAYTYRDVTTTYSVTETDYLINCSGTFTVTLPTAIGFTGEYVIKNGGVGTITVDTTSSQTIDDELTQPIYPSDAMVVRSTGANWIII